MVLCFFNSKNLLDYFSKRPAFNGSVQELSCFHAHLKKCIKRKISSATLACNCLYKMLLSFKLWKEWFFCYLPFFENSLATFRCVLGSYIKVILPILLTHYIFHKVLFPIQTIFTTQFYTKGCQVESCNIRIFNLQRWTILCTFYLYSEILKKRIVVIFLLT